MRDRRDLRNHLRSIHAIALINLGELTTGLALVSTLPRDRRAILVDIRAQYLKKARGELSAEASFRFPGQAFETRDFDVEALLTDVEGDCVARVIATWQIGYQSR